jgi:hypothetical protein
MSESENEDSTSMLRDMNLDVLLAMVFGGLLIVAALGIIVGSSIGVFSSDDGEVGEFEYPNGANESGFEVRTVVQEHGANLQNESFTIVVENQGSDGETVTLTYEYDQENAVSLRTEELTDSRNQIVEDYLNQEIVIAEGLDGNNVTYERNFLQQTTPYTAGFELSSFLQAADYTATEVVQNDNGENVVVYEVSELTERTQQQVDNLEGEVRLSEEGYFTSVAFNITTTSNGQTVTESQSIEFTEVGSTTVEEPEWLATAINQTEEPEPPQPPENGGDEGSEEEGSEEEGSEEEGSEEESG